MNEAKEVAEGWLLRPWAVVAEIFIQIELSERTIFIHKQNVEKKKKSGYHKSCKY